MCFRPFVSGLALAGALAIGVPAFAQVDTEAIFDACSGSARSSDYAGSCLGAVQVAVATLTAEGLTPQEMNSELGMLASAASEAAMSWPPSQRSSFSSVAEVIANASTDPSQRLAIEQLTTSLQNTGSGGVAIPLATPIALSRS